MIIRGLPNEEYHARPEISKSDLDKFARSPAHYLAHKKGLINHDSEVFRFGSAFHSLVIEPQSFDLRYAVAPEGDRRTKEFKKAWSEFLPTIGVREVISQDDQKRLLSMAESVSNHKTARCLFHSCTDFELAVIAENEGVQCRSKLDCVSSTAILDLKSTADASRISFSNSIGKYRYHVQAAFYLDNSRIAGIEVENFFLISVEKDPPFAVQVFELDYASLEEGRRVYKQQLSYVKECLEYNHFPAYSDEIERISLKSWEFNKPIE
jgi:exodeoxyribonuclease VIII